MQSRSFRIVISSALLLLACALGACGKTGALYLPDASPSASPDTTDSINDPSQPQ